MRLWVLGGIAAVVFAWLPAPADAAMAVRIVVTPRTPLAGVPATLSVQTLAPTSEKCVGDPGADHRPWSNWGRPFGLVVEAVRDGRAPILVPLAQRDSDPTWGDGTIVFPESGEWLVRMSYPSWSQAGPDAEACAGARVNVFVADTLPASSSAPFRRDVALVALAVLVTALALARGRYAKHLT